MSGPIEIPREWVDERLDAIAGKTSELEEEIRNLRERIRELRVEGRILKRWRDEFAASENGSRPSDHDAGATATKSLKPSKAVDRFFAEHPGTPREDAADRIIDRGVRSNAKDPRGVVLTAIRRRVRGGELWADDEDRIWPADHPRAKGEQQTRFGPKVTGD